MIIVIFQKRNELMAPLHEEVGDLGDEQDIEERLRSRKESRMVTKRWYILIQDLCGKRCKIKLKI